MTSGDGSSGSDAAPISGERPSPCPVCKARLPPPLLPSGPPRARWPHFPFCSDRCRLVDLGRWLTGGYRVPGASSSSDSSLVAPDLDQEPD